MKQKKEKKEKRQAFNEKQLELAKIVVSGGMKNRTKGEVLASLGYSRTVAEKCPTAVFTSKGFANALVALGVTPETVLTPAMDALEATQSSWYQGELYESAKPDLNIRMKGADQIAEFLGIKKTVVENHNINVNVDSEEISHLFS